MKTAPTLISLVALTIPLFLSPSCKPDDPLVTQAQNSIAAAKTAFAQIDKADNANQLALKHANPRNAAALHLYAQVIRSDSPKWIKTADNALEAYNANKNDSTTANLKSAISVLDSNTTESKRYLATLGTASPP
jgi:hypothetical protein